MRWIARAAMLAFAAALTACATTSDLMVPPDRGVPAASDVSQPTIAPPPVTILVSIDGFRPDYLDRGVTPNLNALAAAGISAAMRPSFPSKTFPNHWTIVTGLRPDRNGIVSNNMQDVGRPDQKFTMENSKDPYWWNAAEPIWVTAEKANIRTATMFWPGSNVAWGGTMAKDWPNDVSNGVRPEDWWPFDIVIPGDQRVDGVIDWLRRPAGTRPRFVTLYFDTIDTAGHTFGPSSPKTTEAVAAIDRTIGRLVAGLRGLGQPVNLVIVADHGMADTSRERTIAMDKIADPGDYTIFETGTFAALYAVPGHEAALEKALLKPHDHLQCWKKSDIPARFHYGANPRVPPYFCLAQVGWLTAKTTPTKEGDRGNHGYDNDAPDMRALFIASGPAIRPLGKLATFDNVDVAPLLRDLLGLPAGQNLDGDDAPFRAALGK
ncbi:alkaline phosphatase family protein [Sphingomonas bacterium]|uniref:alkaline phosphatase family protein n=1 Tax=Sphingomonas bacterium TaxID=1895847 RepID=UPI00262143D8|nr:alkaline phosphatase family protein [Sphingomonas bacterium]MDB5677920.1 alkaline phosphatase family protein [Sphingomonas bacterium]